MTDITDMVVKNGESVARQTVTNVEAQTVRKYNVSNNKPTGRNYKVDWTFDFSGCTQEELLEMAAQSAVIAYRKHFRNLKEGEIIDFAEKHIDVKKDILTHQTRGKSVGEKAKDLFSKMSPEEKAALLAELTA